MTTRNTFRARGAAARTGGRSPQISDGVFEGRTAPPDTIKPSMFTALAYAPTASPSPEWWCYRTGTGPENLTFQAITAAGGTLWLDMVPPEQGFTPPIGAPLGSTPMVEALKAYASARWAAAYYPLVDDPANWVVTVARPFPSQHNNNSRKLEFDKVYAVEQFPVPGSTREHLTGFVWVPKDYDPDGDPTKPGGRELWLHYRMNEPGGFAIVGEIPMGETVRYTRTRLRFTESQVPPEQYSSWDLGNYFTTVQNYVDHAMTHAKNPAASPDEYQLLDYRISDAP